MKPSEYYKHLFRFYDGRFAQHSRFRYYVLNMEQRHGANESVMVYLKSSSSRSGMNSMSVGDLKRLNASGKKDIAMAVQSFTRSISNSPQFYLERRKELKAMIKQFGDPSAF